MYAGSWERRGGAWCVWDERTYNLVGRWETRYFGYSKREAMAVHAQYVRDLRAGRVRR